MTAGGGAWDLVLRSVVDRPRPSGVRKILRKLTSQANVRSTIQRRPYSSDWDEIG